MTEFKLQPGDILVTVNQRKDPISRLKRWAVGPYDHVFLYVGKVGILVTRKQPRILRFPMLFESNGRGVVLQSLSNRYGQDVVILRLKSEHQRKIPRVLTEAIKLASDPQAHYDYSIITLHIIPEVILEKLHLPIPLKYQRDERMICSEAVLEVFLRARVPVLPKNVVPLPGDFVTDSHLLEEVWVGKLCEGAVS